MADRGACRTLVECCRCWTPHTHGAGRPGRLARARRPGGSRRPQARLAAPLRLPARRRAPARAAPARPAGGVARTRGPRPGSHLLLEPTPVAVLLVGGRVGAGAAALAGVPGDHGPAELLGGGGARLQRRHRGPLAWPRRRRGHRASTRTGRRTRWPVGFVLLQHGLDGRRRGPSTSASRWSWALVHAGFVLAESLVLVVFWHANEVARAEQDRLHAEQERALQRPRLLSCTRSVHGQSSVQARLAETDRIRTDLIGTVSHEFRTPLTEHPRRGAHAAQARRRGSTRTPRHQLLHGRARPAGAPVAAAGEHAARPRRRPRPTRRRSAEVDAVAAEVAMLAGAPRAGDPPVSVRRRRRARSPASTGTRCTRCWPTSSTTRSSTARPGPSRSWSPVARTSAGRLADGQQRGRRRSTSREQSASLFLPFTQADSGVTRGARGHSASGLYVVQPARRGLRRDGRRCAATAAGSTVELQPAAGRWTRRPSASRRPRV